MRLWFARDIWRYRNVFWLIDWLILLFVCLFVLQLLLSQEKWSALTMHQHRHGRCSYAHIVITWWSGHELFWRFWWTWRSVGFAILFFVALFCTLRSRLATFSGKFGNMDKSGNSENRENWGERKKLFELFLSRKSCIFHFACNYESFFFCPISVSTTNDRCTKFGMPCYEFFPTYFSWSAKGCEICDCPRFLLVCILFRHQTCFLVAFNFSHCSVFKTLVMHVITACCERHWMCMCVCVCACVHVRVCVCIEGDKVSQYAGLHLHKRIVDNHSYSK